jgi:hypothetical protein
MAEDQIPRTADPEAGVIPPSPGPGLEDTVTSTDSVEGGSGTVVPLPGIRPRPWRPPGPCPYCDPPRCPGCGHPLWGPHYCPGPDYPPYGPIYVGDPVPPTPVWC